MAEVKQRKNKKKLKLNFVFFLIALGIFTFTLFILFLLDMNLANKYALNDIREKNTLEIKNYGNEISNELNTNILIIKNLQSILTKYKQVKEKDRRSYYYNFLYNILRVNAHIKDIFTVWKPYTLDSYDYKFKDYLRGYTGQYAVWIDRDRLSDSVSAGSDELSLLTTYENKFQEYNSDIIVISPIKETKVVGESTNLVRIVGALWGNKGNTTHLIGIVGLDIPVNNLIRILPLDKLQNILLINPSYKIIFAPNSQSISRNIKSYKAGLINYHIYSQLLKNKIYFGKTKREISSSKYFIAYPVRYSDKFWILIKLIPQQEFLTVKRHYMNIIIIGSFAVFFLFFMLLTGYYIVYRKMINFLEELITRLYQNREITGDIENPFKLGYKEYETFVDQILIIQKKYSARVEFIQALNEEKYDIPDLEAISEKDIMAITLNKLKSNLKKAKQIQDEYKRQQALENWRNTGLAKFNEILRTYINDAQSLAYETISNLTDYLDAQVGAFFILETKDGKEVLELAGYYGYNRKIYEKKYFELGDGLTGNVALEKKPAVTQVPSDYVELATGLGKAKPNYIAVYPLLAHDTLYGVIEIAKIHKFEEHHLKFLDTLSEIIASSLATVKINQETKRLLGQSQSVTQQMQDKEAELEKTIKQLEKLQEESKDQQVKLESIISALNEIVYYIEFTKSQRVITVNKQIEEKFNITYKEATEKNFYDLFNIPVIKLDEYKKIWEHVLNGHKTEFDLEINLDNKTFWIKATLVPIIKGLEIDRILFIGFDITSIMAKEAELEKLSLVTKEKEERIRVQEMEMELTMQELEELKIKFEEKEKYIKKLEKELDDLREKHEGLMKEFEKRLSHSRKIEAALREKIKHLSDEVKDLRQQLKDKDKK